MKHTYKPIQSILRLNRIVVVSIIVCSFGFGLYCVSLINEIRTEALNKAFVVSSKGDVIPLQYVEARENLKVELLSHLDKFHRNFYEIDGLNYKEQINKALWMGDQSVSEVFKATVADGHYNRLVQYSSRQEIVSIESLYTISPEVIQFQTTIVFNVVRGESKEKWERITTGNVSRVKRSFPYNPHGLLISRFFEKSLKKVKE